ncbi:MAG: agmatine deiminase family protein [Muribaculaceae bacterium]|nr:agmatine deiminase family protein [Muribaculaceae bacterium]
MNNEYTGYTLPAEWEADCTILLAWPHDDTDWAYMLDEVRTCYANLITAITGTGRRVIIAGPGISANMPQCLRHIPKELLIPFDVPTNDTWTRDYGIISLKDTDGNITAGADFKFNGWGLKFASDKDNLVTRRMKEAGLINAQVQNLLGFVLEGGGIESDGKGSLLTTAKCQMSPNRNAQFTRAEIMEHLSRYLGVRHQLWLEHGYLAGDDTDSHIDTLARFAPNDTIIYTGCDDPADEHYQELATMKQELMDMTTPQGMNYNLVELPLPDAIYDEEGTRLPATYANFLVTPDALFMPTYGQPMKDRLAEQILSIAFTQKVHTVDCRALIKQHGSLHCATMQIPNSILSI